MSMPALRFAYAFSEEIAEAMSDALLAYRATKRQKTTNSMLSQLAVLKARM